MSKADTVTDIGSKRSLFVFGLNESNAVRKIKPGMEIQHVAACCYPYPLTQISQWERWPSKQHDELTPPPMQ
jgi:hypothetical protein